MLYMGGGIANKGISMTPEAPQHTQRVFGPEGTRQKPVGMQPLEPLTVRYVGFPARDILHMSGVDQLYCKPSSFEDLIQGNPIDTGRLHDHGLDTAAFQPISHGVQISRKAFEGAHRVFISVFGYRDPVFCGAYIDAGCICINDRKGVALLFL